MYAKQMAQISALKSSTGVGAGYGVATYQTFSADTTDLKSLELKLSCHGYQDLKGENRGKMKPFWKNLTRLLLSVLINFILH